MNNRPLDPKLYLVTDKDAIASTYLHKKSRSTIPSDNILERLVDFAFSMPDFSQDQKSKSVP